jgi:outer membrane immunogenic protein
MKKFLLASVAAVAFASGAQAADLGVPRGAIAGVVVAPVFNWTGFYVGADIGYLWSSTNVFATNGGGPSTGSPNPHGIKIGGHVGYRYQFANNFVLGIEGDLSWLGARNREATIGIFAPQVWRTRANWDASIRGTAGFAIDRALIYATGGVAFIDSPGCASVNPGGVCVPGSNFGGSRVGWTVGAGLAYAVTPNVSVRGEYLYANYGTRTYATAAIVGGFTAYKLDTHTVRLGVSYMFTTGGSAVVARY